MRLRSVALCIVFLAVCIVPLAVAVAAKDESVDHPPFTEAVVQKFDNQTLTATTDKGNQISMAVPATTPVTRERQLTVADVKSGQFIHCKTKEGPGGKLIAREIYILPEQMRGGAEGRYPTAETNVTMTNGTIEKIPTVATGQTMLVSYKGGQSDVEIPQDVKVTTLEFAGVDALKPGTKLKFLAQEDPPGKWTARYLNLEK